MQPPEIVYLLIIRDFGRQMLVEPGSQRLPMLAISPSSDLADLSSKAKEAYGVNLCLLFSYTSAEVSLPAEPGDVTLTFVPSTERRVFVAELLTECESPVPELVWSRTDGIRANEREQQLMIEGLQQLWDRRIGRIDDPLGRPGWWTELTAFRRDPGEEQVEVTHQRGGGAYASFRLETSTRTVWLKAASRTAGIASTELEYVLNDLRLPSLPEVLGFVRSSSHCWDGIAQEHVEGTLLEETAKAEDWIETARRIAELQVASTGTAELLCRHGCENWCISRIEHRARLLFGWLTSEIAYRNNSFGITAAPTDISSLHDYTAMLLRRFKRSDMPQSLVCLRFPTDSLVVHPLDGPRFVKWDDTAVSHPFVWWHHFAEASEQSGQCAASRNALREAYLAPWVGVIDPAEIPRVLEDSDFLACLIDALRIAFPPRAVLIDENAFLHQREVWAWDLLHDRPRCEAFRREIRKLQALRATNEVLA